MKKKSCWNFPHDFFLFGELFHVTNPEVDPFRFNFWIVVGFVDLGFRTAEDNGVDELVDDRKFVVVDRSYLMPETGVAANLVSVTLFLELFGNGIGAE